MWNVRYSQLIKHDSRLISYRSLLKKIKSECIKQIFPSSFTGNKGQVTENIWQITWKNFVNSNSFLIFAAVNSKIWNTGKE